MNQTNNSSGNLYFKNLDLIRFLAALFVVMAHGFEAWKDYFVRFRLSVEEQEKVFSGLFHNLDRFAMSLGIGVEIFFFISGFLITYILLQEKNEFGKISIFKFYLRRGLRIWPLYFLLLLFGPFVTNWVNLGDPNYLAQVLFIGNFETIYAVKWEYPFAHYWSIAIEEQFYLVWPLVIAFAPRRMLKSVFISIILFSIISRGYYFLNSDQSWLHIHLNTLCRMDTLVIGAFLALLKIENKLRFNIPLLFTMLLIISLLVSLFFIPYAQWDSIYSAMFKKYFYLIVFGIAIMNLVLNPKLNYNGWLFNKMAYLGKISYGIYMYHNIMVIIVIKRILLNNNIDSWLAYALVYISSVLIISIISFELFEKPFLRLKERFALIKTRTF